VLAPPELEPPVPELEDAPEDTDPVAADPLVAALESLLGTFVAPVAPVAPVVPVAALDAGAEVGTVIGGATELSASAPPPPPQAVRPRMRRKPPASSASVRDRESTPVNLPWRQEPRGSIRLPQ
jgi:hypothetical protein